MHQEYTFATSEDLWTRFLGPVVSTIEIEVPLCNYSEDKDSERHVFVIIKKIDLRIIQFSGMCVI